MEWPPQTQQYKQDEKAEKYPEGKEQDKCPPNKRGRDREST